MLEVSKGILPREYSSWDEINGKIPEEWRDGKASPIPEESMLRTPSSIDWGKFAPAIARWEAVLGRQAPAPTKPDGKDGAHRLSSAFTEWMMGLPDGWITDVGLSRNDELKACGNGVVPQQAALALRVLLAGIPFDSEPGGGRVLPTPTVMDQQSMPLRAVAVENLKSGRNRGIGLNNLVENIGLDWQDGDTFTVVDGKVTKNDPESS